MRENAKVAYTGANREIEMGAEGTVLATDAGVSHVRWASGPSAGLLVAVYDHDLVPLTGRTASADVEDSLEVGSLTAFSARRTYDEGSAVAVVNAMAEQGHLASFGDIAEEALTLVASRIRQDPSMQVVLAALEEEEGESVLRLASACLVRDAFTEE